jgi:hypothetical protein
VVSFWNLIFTAHEATIFNVTASVVVVAASLLIVKDQVRVPIANMVKLDVEANA